MPYELNITVEFMKGNKVKYVEGAEGKQETLGGTYKIEGDMLTTHVKIDGNETTKTTKIIKLSEKECTLKDDKRDAEETTLKKIP
ncbi:MAG: hypothetical protein U0796_02895 [Gemmatales bacterium]